MRRFKSIAAVVLLIACQAYGAQFFFTTTPTLTSITAPVAAGINPTLFLPSPMTTGDLYLWAKLAPNDADGFASERINGVGLDLVQGSPGPIAHGAGFVVYNTVGVPVVQRRWATPVPLSNGPSGLEFLGGPGDSTLARFRRAAHSGKIGLQSLDTELGTVADAAGNSYLRFADISIQIDPSGPHGPVPVFLRTNIFEVSYDQAFPNKGPNVFFGAGDPAVDPRYDGVQSALPDAFIQIDPEPASLPVAMAVIGGFCRFGIFRSKNRGGMA